MKKIRTQLRIADNSFVLSSAFDNGNLSRVDLIEPCTLRLEAAVDNPEDPDSCLKTYFHFSLTGVAPGQSIKFLFRPISQLKSLMSDIYRPYYKEQSMRKYQRISGTVRVFDSGELQFQHRFKSSEQTFFAYGAPYSYRRYQQLITHLSARDNVLVRQIGTSIEKRPIHSVSICQDVHTSNPADIPSDKVVVLVTARVHPGESPSSYLAQALIEQLLQQTKTAQLLRKLFYFIFVPMLNPDGVYHGNYRLDTNAQNLNRCYKNPSFRRQPTIFAVKRLMEQLSEMKRAPQFFFDLHAHPSSKGFFLYGNAIDIFSMHLENVLFSRLLEVVNPDLEHALCNFSKKEMKADRTSQSQSNKEGCARVCAFRMFNIAHCYTVELGIHTTSRLKARDSLLQTCHYSNFADSLLISLLQLFQLNPGSSLTFSIQNLRSEIANQVAAGQDRFRMFFKTKLLKKMEKEMSKAYYFKQLAGKQLGQLILLRQKKAKQIAILAGRSSKKYPGQYIRQANRIRKEARSRKQPAITCVGTQEGQSTEIDKDNFYKHRLFQQEENRVERTSSEKRARMSLSRVSLQRQRASQSELKVQGQAHMSLGFSSSLFILNRNGLVLQPKLQKQYRQPNYFQPSQTRTFHLLPGLLNK